MYLKYPVLDMIQRMHLHCGSFGSRVTLTRKIYVGTHVKITQQWKFTLRSLYSHNISGSAFRLLYSFFFKLSISFRLLVWMHLYFQFFLFVYVRTEVLIVALYCWFDGLLTFYFGGARSKGIAMLGNVPKLLFWDKIGHAKSFRQV